MNDILIIFDIDGTLSDTNSVDEESIFQAFKNLYNFDLKSANWSDYPHATDWGISESILTNELKLSNVSEELKRVEEEFVRILDNERKINPEKFQAVENSVEFFNLLKESNYSLGIATGAWKKSAEVKLNAIGMDYKDIPFANSNDHYSREHITKTCIKRASEKYDRNFKNEDILYFGDGAWDYKTTLSLGIDFIGVDAHSNGKLFELGQKEIISDYTEVDYILELIDVIKNG